MTRISSRRITMEGGRVDQAALKAYGEYVGANGSNADSFSVLDIRNGNVFSLVLNQPSCGLAFINPAPVGVMCSFTLILKQDATGGRAVSWPSSVLWPNTGMAPSLTATANSFDVFVFVTTSGGNLWLGLVAGKNYS